MWPYAKYLLHKAPVSSSIKWKEGPHSPPSSFRLWFSKTLHVISWRKSSYIPVIKLHFLLCFKENRHYFRHLCTAQEAAGLLGNVPQMPTYKNGQPAHRGLSLWLSCILLLSSQWAPSLYRELSDASFWGSLAIVLNWLQQYSSSQASFCNFKENAKGWVARAEIIFKMCFYTTFHTNSLFFCWDTSPICKPAGILICSVTRSQVSVINSAHGHLPNILKHLLETTQLVATLSWTQLTAAVFMVSVGGSETSAPPTSATVMRYKTLFCFAKQLPKTQESNTILIYFQALCHKPYHVREKAKNCLAFLFCFVLFWRFPNSWQQYAFIFQSSWKRSRHGDLWEQKCPNWSPLNWKALQLKLRLLFSLRRGIKQNKKIGRKTHRTGNYHPSVAASFFPLTSPIN